VVKTSDPDVMIGSIKVDWKVAQRQDLVRASFALHH